MGPYGAQPGPGPNPDWAPTIAKDIKNVNGNGDPRKDGKFRIFRKVDGKFTESPRPVQEDPYGPT